MKTTFFILAFWLACGAAPRAFAAAAKKGAAPKASAGARVAAGGVKAASAAIADFSEHLKGMKLEEDMRPWMKALEVVENYEIEIHRDGAQWVVRFRPVLTNLLDGTDVKGGGAEYRVDPSSYKIIDRTFWK